MLDKRVATGNETVAERLTDAFHRHGVTVAFGQSIPTAFHLAAPHFGIKQAVYRTENAGGAMADAYARNSHRVACVAAWTVREFSTSSRKGIRSESGKSEARMHAAATITSRVRS